MLTLVLRRRGYPKGESECAHIWEESCIVRGSCILGGVFELFMLFASCVELCLFLEGPTLHMLGCVEHCLFLEGSSMFWSQCVELLPFPWGLTLLALLSPSDLFWLSLLLITGVRSLFPISLILSFDFISARVGCGVDNALIKGEIERQWRPAPWYDE